MLHTPDFLDFVGTLPTWLVMFVVGLALLAAWDVLRIVTGGRP